MKKLQYIILSLLSIVIFSCGSDDEKTNNDNTDNYPDADAVYISMKKEYTLNNDGSIDFRYSHRLKYITFLSFNRFYGETFVVYNPKVQKLKINKCLTTMADGKQVETPKNAFNEVLPEFATNFPFYNHFREMVITHTALEKGAIVDLEYEINSDKKFMPVFMGLDRITQGSPVKEMTYVVKVPENQELNYKLVNSDIKPAVSESDGYKVYTWTFKDVKPSQKDLYEGGKGIVLSFGAREMSVAINNLKAEPGYINRLDGKIAAKVEEFVKGGKKDIPLALEIQNFVSTQFNQYHIPAEHMINNMRTAEEVWKSNGGTTLELAILLKDMLIWAGFDASVEGICENEFFDHKVGNLLIFNEYVVKIKTPEEIFYLSPLYSNRADYEFDLEAGFVPIENYGNQEIVDKVLPGNAIIISGNIKLTGTKLTGKLTGLFEGLCHPYYALLKDENSASTLFSLSSKAKLTENKKPFSKVDFEILSDGFAKEQSGYFFINFPMATGGVDSWYMTRLGLERTGDLVLPKTIIEKYDYEIELPEGMKTIVTGVDEKIKNKAGKVKITISEKDGKLKLVREIELTKPVIKPSEYKDFKKLMALWNNKKYREIVLKK